MKDTPQPEGATSRRLTRDGYLLLPRALFDEPYSQLTDKQFRLFVHLLQRARWKAGADEWWDGKEHVRVCRGQCVVSYRRLAQELRQSVGAIEKGIAAEVKLGLIRRQRGRQGHTIITIVDYETYQDPSAYQKTPEKTARRHREDGQKTRRKAEGHEGRKERGAPALPANKTGGARSTSRRFDPDRSRLQFRQRQLEQLMRNTASDLKRAEYGEQLERVLSALRELGAA